MLEVVAVVLIVQVRLHLVGQVEQVAAVVEALTAQLRQSLEQQTQVEAVVALVIRQVLLLQEMAAPALLSSS